MTEKRWFTLDDGRQVYRSVRFAPVARSSFPCPKVKSDSIEPTLGLDGKMHDSRSSFMKTMMPDGNPQGQRYYDLGSDSLEHQEVKFDKEQRIETIKRAIHDVETGNVPELAQIDL